MGQIVKWQPLRDHSVPLVTFASDEEYLNLYKFFELNRHQFHCALAQLTGCSSRGDATMSVDYLREAVRIHVVEGAAIAPDVS